MWKDFELLPSGEGTGEGGISTTVQRASSPIVSYANSGLPIRPGIWQTAQGAVSYLFGFRENLLGDWGSFEMPNCYTCSCLFNGAARAFRRGQRYCGIVQRDSRYPISFHFKDSANPNVFFWDYRWPILLNRIHRILSKYINITEKLRNYPNRAASRRLPQS